MFWGCKQKLSKGSRVEFFPFPSGKYDKAIAQRHGRINRLKWKGRLVQIRGLIHLPDNLAHSGSGEDWQPTNHHCACFTWLSNERGITSTLPQCTTQPAARAPRPFFCTHKVQIPCKKQWTFCVFKIKPLLFTSASVTAYHTSLKELLKTPLKHLTQPHNLKQKQRIETNINLKVVILNKLPTPLKEKCCQNKVSLQ